MWSMICPQTLSKEKFKAQSRDRPPIDHSIMGSEMEIEIFNFLPENAQSFIRLLNFFLPEKGKLYFTFKIFDNVLKARNVIYDMSSNIIKREIQSAK